MEYYQGTQYSVLSTRYEVQYEECGAARARRDLRARPRAAQGPPAPAGGAPGRPIVTTHALLPAPRGGGGLAALLSHAGTTSNKHARVGRQTCCTCLRRASFRESTL
eukprot:333918-Pyramimonas_sp.AAC.1